MNTNFNNTKPLNYSGAQVNPTTHDQSQSGARMHNTLDGAHEPGRFHNSQTQTSHAAVDPHMHTSNVPVRHGDHPSGGIHAGARHGLTGGDVGHDPVGRSLNDQAQTSHIDTHSGGRAKPAYTTGAAPVGAAGPRTQTSGDPMGPDIHPTDHAHGTSSGPAHHTSATHSTPGGINHPHTDLMNERKPTVGEKIKGNLEKISGRMTDNPSKMAHGEQLAHAAKPAEH